MVRTGRSRYSGRSAHVTRSARLGCSYDGEIEPLYNSSEGLISKREYLARRQRSGHKARFSMYLGSVVNTRFPRRSCACGGEIHFLADGRAVCKSCSVVFNDGGNIEGMVQVTHHYLSGEKKAAPPPKQMVDRNERAFFKAVKA